MLIARFKAVEELDRSETPPLSPAPTQRACGEPRLVHRGVESAAAVFAVEQAREFAIDGTNAPGHALARPGQAAVVEVGFYCRA